MKLYFSAVVFWCLAANCNGVIVDTKLGKIEGFASKSLNGSPISNFMGIPFAKPPVGPLRFKKPEPVEPWTGILQAKQTVECTQYDRFIKHGVIGQEDCLVLNIYVPSKPRNDQDLLPVMFFIHGGAFFMGSGSPDLYGPERFLDYDVILVTTNYRLGALGFMSTSNDDMPGNLGLWDQNLALKWVQNNIREFGGDPNKVTIFGESAGAMSVLFHYLSPQSRGLFQGAITQSGVATSTFLKVDKNPIYYARSLASKVGCSPQANTKALVKCLQEADGDTIQGFTMLYPQMEFYPLVFKPYIDDYTSDPFVPKDPWELIESGEFQHVPLIIGNNQDEGLLSALVFYNNQSLLEQLTERWENELGPLYLFGRELDDVDPEVVQLTQEVSQFAFPEDKKPTKETIMTGYKDVISDVVFNAVGSITARKIAQKSKSNVYEYLYKHRGTLGLSDLLKMKWWKVLLKFVGQFVGLNLFCPEHGVGHADELFLMFKTQKIPIEGVYTDSDKATSQNLLQLWTDFAKTGNPTPDTKEWTKITDSNKARMEIGSGTLKMNLDETLEHRVKFWTKIWNKLPTNQRFKSSQTWSNPMLHGATNAIDVGMKEAKDEL